MYNRLTSLVFIVQSATEILTVFTTRTSVLLKEIQFDYTKDIVDLQGCHRC